MSRTASFIQNEDYEDIYILRLLIGTEQKKQQNSYELSKKTTTTKKLEIIC
jgi:hypothetical protein